MKFGQYLEAQRVQEWAQYYLDYKGLKSMIKALAEVEAKSNDLDVGKTGYGERVTSLSMVPNPQVQAKYNGKVITDSDFFTALESEMAKIDKFTHEQLLAVKNATDALEDRIGMLGNKTVELTEQQRQEGMKEATKLGDDFLKIEKFANLNYLGFHKILKKHDKNLPIPCRRFYLTRLHGQRWVKHDYSKVFVDLSKIHAFLRGDKSGKDEGTGAQNFVRTTTKYWVRTEDISKVKHIVLQHLPVFQHNLDALPGDSQFCSSVYFDNTQLELYHGRLDKSPNAIAIRMRWYATESPELVFVERKTHHDSWTGDVSVKERFTLKEKQVMPFLRGQFTVEDKIAEMKKAGKTEGDQENVRRLFSEIYNQIDSKQLRPTMRTVYNRVAYQIPFDATVRVSLDTNLTMIRENPLNGPDCMSQDRWFRDPNIALPPTEFTAFPHAVLEVKLSLKEGDDAPQWVTDLINSGLVTQVHKFSKFIHGCATLMGDDVQAVPYWVDDISIQPSMLRSQRQTTRRSFMEPDKKGSSSKKSSPFPFGAGEPIQLMSRTPSAMMQSGGGATRYGTTGNGEAQGLTHDYPILLEQSQGFCAWLFSPVQRCLFGSSSTHAMGAKPRKTPMKVEPKVFLANERTLLNWLSMAITLGSIAAALLGFSSVPRKGMVGTAKAGSLGEESAHIIGMLLLPVSIIFCGYALVTFYWRAQRLRTRTEGIFHDEIGPFLLGGVLMVALSAIFLLHVSEFLSS